MGNTLLVERPLRVALLWNGVLLREHLLMQPQDVVLGTHRDVTLPVPDGVLEQEQATLLTPSAGGYELQPIAGMEGALWLQGRRLSTRSLHGPVTLGSGDYGLLSFGSATVYFQHVQRVRGEVPRRSFRDGALFGCFGLSVFSHVVALLFFFLVAAKELAPVAALELDSALLTKMLTVPPPEDPFKLARKKESAGLEDPGLRDRDEAGGKRAKNDEGRVGKRDATEARTEIAGAPAEGVAAQVRTMGLLGVLSGGQGVQSALDTPSLDSLLGGLGSAQTVLGQGSGGLSLRGAGAGGGGKTSGVMYGAGELGTAVAGGKGLGRGADSLAGKGRPTAERTLSMDSAAARVSGFLSREQINRVVQANRAAIKYCFESALQQKPELQGAIHAYWRIDRQGNVSSTRVEKSTLGDAKVEGCILRQIKRWKFPQPDGGEVDVTYPFLFRGR